MNLEGKGTIGKVDLCSPEEGNDVIYEGYCNDKGQLMSKLMKCHSGEICDDGTYEGKGGKKHTPIMIHRAVLGTLDRFIGILIEHCAGKFPLWISPIQVQFLTINDNVVDYAEQVQARIKGR